MSCRYLSSEIRGNPHSRRHRRLKAQQVDFHPSAASKKRREGEPADNRERERLLNYLGARSQKPHREREKPRDRRQRRHQDWTGMRSRGFDRRLSRMRP